MWHASIPVTVQRNYPTSGNIVARDAHAQRSCSWEKKKWPSCLVLSKAPTWTCASAWPCVTKRSTLDKLAEKESCWASRSCCTWRSLFSCPVLQKRWARGSIVVDSWSYTSVVIFRFALTFILKILQRVCLSVSSQPFPPFNNIFTIYTQKPTLESASHSTVSSTQGRLWAPPRVGCELYPGLTVSSIQGRLWALPRVSCEVQPDLELLAWAWSSRRGRTWLLSDPGGNIRNISDIRRSAEKQGCTMQMMK